MWQEKYRDLFNKNNFHKYKDYIIVFIKGVLTSIDENKCLIRAGSLTYVTTLSIVPFLAVAFSLLKGLGFHHTEFIHNVLLKLTASKKEIVENILTYINNTNVGKLGTMGMATLLLVVLSLLGTIEDTLNAIFEIPKNRNFKQKITHYFSMTLLSPILLIVLVTFSSSISSIGFVKKLLTYSIISHVYFFVLKIVPFFVVWISIFMIFYYLPNGKVDFKSVVVGSFCASILWQISSYVFINYHPFNVKYNAIYGSFAKVLLVLLWIFVSWFLLLIGAVIAHEIKSIRYGRYKYHKKLGYFNIAFKEYVFLRIILFMIDMFKKGDGVLSVDDLSDSLNLPSFILMDFLKALQELGFIVSVEDRNNKSFVISSSIDRCSLSYFMQLIRNYNDISLDNLKLYRRDYSKNIIEDIEDKEITLSNLNLELQQRGIF